MSSSFVSRVEDIGGPFGPITRYLPILPSGIINFQQNQKTKRIEYLYDPTGVSPQLLTSLVAKGYRVITSASNPVDRFLIRLYASPPKLDTLNAVMADLALARFEDKRLESHLQQMYKSTCSECGNEVIVDHYIWSSSDDSICAKVYNCNCGNGGEFPATQEDIDLAKKWKRSDGLYRSGVIEKFKNIEGVDDQDIRDHLRIYSPRALHGLELLANRAESMYPPGAERDCLRALTLFAADRCNALWQIGELEYRPKLIHLPPNYTESNIWSAILEGYRFLKTYQSTIMLCNWPELPPEQGVSMFAGSARRFLPASLSLSINDIVCVLPRPNQAYYTLSGVWSRWLFGCDASEEFLSVLRRKRFDWLWYRSAIKALLKNLKKNYSTKHYFIFFITEIEPAYLESVIFTIAECGFRLRSILPSVGIEIIKIECEITSADPESDASVSQDHIDELKAIVTNILDQEQQPMEYIQLLIKLLDKLGKTSHPLLTGSIPAFEKDLSTVLKGPSFKDVENRATVETGLWQISGVDDQQPLAGI